MVDRAALSSAIAEFLSYVSIEKGLSKNTIRAYSGDLHKLQEFMVLQDIELNQIDPLVMDNFLGWLRGAG